MAFVKRINMRALINSVRYIPKPSSIFNFGSINSTSLQRSYSTNSSLATSALSTCLGRRVPVNFNMNIRQFGSSVFHHDENMNARRILESLPDYKNLLFEYDEQMFKIEVQAGATGNGSVIKSSVRFKDSILAFVEIASASQETQLPITHPKYEDVMKNVLSDLKQLTDEELCQLLYHMRMFAPCPSSRDPSYQKIWKQIDNECQSRSLSWSADFNFVVADLWYGLGLARLSEFHWTLLKRLFRRVDKLKREHFVRFMFCLNLNRLIPDNAAPYDLEFTLNKLIDQMSAEELVIISMGFFKTQYSIKDPELVKKLLTTVMKSSKTLESVSLAAICKIVRYSTDGKCAQAVHDFQESFLPEVDRLSMSALTHVALLPTNSLSPNKEMVQKVVEKLVENITNARLKEIERMTLAATMLNVDCDELCKLVALELQKPERADEIRKYGRCLPAILHYLSMREIFIPDLMSMCLSKAFRDTYYGRGKELLQRELLCLDIAADIEIPGYTGSRLEEKVAKFVMKRNMLWRKPPTKTNVPVYEKFIRSFSEAMHAELEDKELFCVCNILPQHHTMAVVYCRDKEGKLASIPQYFYDIPEPHIKKLPSTESSELSYNAILLCGRGMCLWNDPNDLTGQAILQIRQTKRLGYKTHLVFYPEWNLLPDLEARRKFIQDIISQQ